MKFDTKCVRILFTYIDSERKEVIRLKIGVTFDDVIQHKTALAIAHWELQTAAKAETDVLIRVNYSYMEQPPKKKAHIRRKAYKNQADKDDLDEVVHLLKNANANHQNMVLKLKECICQYAGVPSWGYYVKVTTNRDRELAEIKFSLSPYDVNWGHYQVNLITGDIKHLREYGESTNKGPTLSKKKVKAHTCG